MPPRRGATRGAGTRRVWAGIPELARAQGVTPATARKRAADIPGAAKVAGRWRIPLTQAEYARGAGVSYSTARRRAVSVDLSDRQLAWRDAWAEADAWFQGGTGKLALRLHKPNPDLLVVRDLFAYQVGAPSNAGWWSSTYGFTFRPTPSRIWERIDADIEGLVDEYGEPIIPVLENLRLIAAWRAA